MEIEEIIKENPELNIEFIYAKRIVDALSKINSKPEESLFIDDSQVNIDGAKNVGIQGFLYTDVDSFIEYIKSLGIDLEK